MTLFPLLAAPAAAELSVWDLCLKGGIIMIPLALLSLVSIYIFFERWAALRKAATEDATFMKRIKDYIHDGEIESAEMLCKKTDTPYARLIQKGISRIGRPMNDVLVAIENVGNIEVAKLGKGFTWLATTAAGAPMLGFLGTVTGMVKAFFALSNAGSNANISAGFEITPYRHGSQTSARFTRLIQHGVDDRRDFLAAHIFHGHVDFRVAHGI